MSPALVRASWDKPAGCNGGDAPAPEQQPAPRLDTESLGRALLDKSEVPSALTEVGTMPVGTKEAQFGANDAARAGQAQPLPGVTWEPAACSALLEAGFEDIRKISGAVRLYAADQSGNRAAGGGVQGGLVASAVVNASGSPFQADLVRKKLAQCEQATVVLDAFGGAAGRITQQEVESPRVEGAEQSIAWRQTVTFGADLPAEARAFADLFNAEAAYLSRGDALVWVSTAGRTDTTVAELAATAMGRARRALRI